MYNSRSHTGRTGTYRAGPNTDAGSVAPNDSISQVSQRTPAPDTNSSITTYRIKSGGNNDQRRRLSIPATNSNTKPSREARIRNWQDDVSKAQQPSVIASSTHRSNATKSTRNSQSYGGGYKNALVLFEPARGGESQYRANDHVSHASGRSRQPSYASEASEYTIRPSTYEASQRRNSGGVAASERDSGTLRRTSWKESDYNKDPRRRSGMSDYTSIRRGDRSTPGPGGDWESWDNTWYEYTRYPDGSEREVTERYTGRLR